MTTEENTSRQLTELQRAFVIAYTSTLGCIGKVKEAAIAAGYSPKTAHEIGRQALALPHVREAVFQANADQISGSLLTKAVNVLERILDDPKSPPRMLLDAAKTIMDRGGLAATVSAQDLRGDPLKKDFAEMSPQELSEVVRVAGEERRRIEARLAALPPRTGAH